MSGFLETHPSNLVGYNALYYCVHFTEKETMTWSDQDTEPEFKAWGGGDQENGSGLCLGHSPRLKAYEG